MSIFQKELSADEITRRKAQHIIDNAARVAKENKKEAVKAKPDSAPVTMKDLRDLGLV